MISWKRNVYGFHNAIFMQKNIISLGPFWGSGAVLTDRRTAERSIMQVGNSMNNRYCTQYQGCFSSKETVRSQNSGEKVDYAKILKEKVNEICTKIKNGDTEPSYQIGAQSFTEKEWKKFLENFDSIEEVIEKQMKEEHEKKEEEVKNEAVDINAAGALLTTEYSSCVYEQEDLCKDDVRYITWYTEDGIFCRKAGQTEGYEWYIRFKNKNQYEKVTEFIQNLPSGWNMRFAAHESFWNDFLSGEIDKNNIQWDRYTNPPTSR